jgi:hypothetical protein
MDWVSVLGLVIAVAALLYTGYQDYRYRRERKWLERSFLAVLPLAIKNSPPEEVVEIIEDQLQHLIRPKKN